MIKRARGKKVQKSILKKPMIRSHRWHFNRKRRQMVGDSKLPVRPIPNKSNSCFRKPIHDPAKLCVSNVKYFLVWHEEQKPLEKVQTNFMLQVYQKYTKKISLFSHFIFWSNDMYYSGDSCKIKDSTFLKSPSSSQLQVVQHVLSRVSQVHHCCLTQKFTTKMKPHYIKTVNMEEMRKSSFPPQSHSHFMRAESGMETFWVNTLVPETNLVSWASTGETCEWVNKSLHSQNHNRGCFCSPTAYQLTIVGRWLTN